MLYALKYLVPLSLISWVLYSNYVLCPSTNSLNTSTIVYDFPYDKWYQFTQVNCDLITKATDSFDHEKVIKAKDNAFFYYKIHIDTRIRYFNHFVYPKITTWVNKNYTETKSVVLPMINHFYQLTKLEVEKIITIIKLRLIQLQLEIVNTSWYQKFTQTKIYGYIMEFFEMTKKFLENPNFHSFNEKRVFLQQEFKNLVNVKFNALSGNNLNNNDDLVDVVKNILPNDESDDESDGDDEEGPLTVRLTSTIYETPGAMSTLTPFEAEVQRLLTSFEHKVDKTVESGFSNIKNEINPIINVTIDNLTPQFTEKMKTIQQNNYKEYKRAHELIKQVDKDSNKIKQTNDTSIETVSRQDMRDLIQNVRDYTDEEAEKVGKVINNNYQILVNQYLNIIQETIDILETFADVSFQEFSNQLNSLLMASDDEEYNWGIWKKFHQFKVKLLSKRDFIFNQSKLLKDKQFDQLEINNDFTKWIQFVNLMDHHLSFISNDNQEYMLLVRAQANVAFQMREGLIREIEQQQQQQEEEANTNKNGSDETEKTENTDHSDNQSDHSEYSD